MHGVLPSLRNVGYCQISIKKCVLHFPGQTEAVHPSATEPPHPLQDVSPVPRIVLLLLV